MRSAAAAASRSRATCASPHPARASGSRLRNSASSIRFTIPSCWSISSGPGAAKRILFTGALIDAAEALHIGLIDLIADSADSLLAPILAASPHSIRQSKAMIRRVLDGQSDDDAETLAMFAKAFEGADFREGVEAFLEKRVAQFE